ncbi:MAG: hypothetical protein ACF8XB_24845 [Planctomycetota bacterium JB042]
MNALRRLPALSSLLLLVGLAACQTAPIALAPSTIPLEPGEYTELGPTSGSAFGFSILFIPITGSSQADDARDAAIADRSGDALINVTADVTTVHLFVVNFVKTTVYGDAVKLR